MCFVGALKQITAAKGLSYLWLLVSVTCLAAHGHAVGAPTMHVLGKLTELLYLSYRIEKFLLSCVISQVKYFGYCNASTSPVSSPPTHHDTGLPCPACHCPEPRYFAYDISPPVKVFGIVNSYFKDNRMAQ